ASSSARTRSRIRRDRPRRTPPTRRPHLPSLRASSLTSVVAAVPEVIRPVAARRRAHARRNLVPLGLAELALRECHRGVAADDDHRDRDQHARENGARRPRDAGTIGWAWLFSRHRWSSAPWL